MNEKEKTRLDIENLEQQIKINNCTIRILQIDTVLGFFAIVTAVVFAGWAALSLYDSTFTDTTSQLTGIQFLLFIISLRLLGQTK